MISLRAISQQRAAYLRRYWIPSIAVMAAIFIADDFVTSWHHHGRDSNLHIIVENSAEDLAVLAFYGYLRWLDVWQTRPIPHWHCECPQCHFKWVMHPKQRVRACPHCNAPEPTLSP